MQNTDLFLKEEKELDILSRPLAFRMRPKSLKDFVGQEEIVGETKLLNKLIENKNISSMIFFGPSGSGKTALVNIIANTVGFPVAELNAVTSGVAELRKILDQAKILNTQNNKKLLVMIDELHHFNKTQQDALLPSMESGSIILIGLTTENPYFYVNSAIISRAIVFEFKKLNQNNIIDVLKRALDNKELGYGKYKIKVNKEILEYISAIVNGDARYALNILETVLNSYTKLENLELELEFVKKIFRANVKYDKAGDNHYDVISAFIKSMRGSDPDAVLYWLALMLNAGEDPRFIARRIAICAAEDVGLADPNALCVAQSAWDLVERVGMPEARIILAHAATLVACSPKSNASYMGIEKALNEIRKGNVLEVPNHLKDAALDGEGKSNHGVGYKYAHDYKDHFVKQLYTNKYYSEKYYSPAKIGREALYRERLEKLWGKTEI
jgi:putative ATPase